MKNPDAPQPLRWQSTLLTWTSAILTIAVPGILIRLEWFSGVPNPIPTPGMFITSAIFVILVLGTRAATVPAALLGGGFCLLLIAYTCGDPDYGPTLWHSGLPSLIALFLLTFAATRWRRAKKQSIGVAESKRGRAASQVAANLSVACIAPAVLLCVLKSSDFACTVALAALAEATADTLSSEIGQAIGGKTIMITNLHSIAVGIDGGISLGGSLAGILGAAAIAVVGYLTMPLSPLQAFIAFIAAIFGLFFDSVLGAIVERRGWLNNDLVNFTSTLAAALLAAGILMHI